jgi:hypothetical protein
MIDLAHCTTVKSADLKSKKRHSFEISTPEITFLLYADTEHEKDDWIGRVGKAIVRCSSTYYSAGGNNNNTGGGQGGGGQRQQQNQQQQQFRGGGINSNMNNPYQQDNDDDDDIYYEDPNNPSEFFQLYFCLQFVGAVCVCVLEFSSNRVVIVKFSWLLLPSFCYFCTQIHISMIKNRFHWFGLFALFVDSQLFKRKTS